MFCVMCGANLPDDSNYRNKCGNPVIIEPVDQMESPPQQYTQRFQPFQDRSHSSRVYQAAREPEPHSAYSQAWANDISAQDGYTHPYQKLGGWLKYIVYAPLVAMGFLTIAFIYDLYATFQLIQYLRSFADTQYTQFFGPLTIAILLISVVGYGAACFFSVKFSMMLKNKNPKFLRFYEITMIIACAIYIIVIALNGFKVDAPSLRMIISSVLGCILGTLYFRKSVRVHIYMGNDDYLKNSIFSKNAAVPVSLELNQYVPPHTNFQQQPVEKEAVRSKQHYYSPGKRTYERKK